MESRFLPARWLRPLTGLVFLLCHACCEAQFDWGKFLDSNSRQTGEATFYGQDPMQDGMGKCSFSKNYANTNHMPWTRGIAGTIALNKADFDDGKACGMCIMFRGTGGGTGTTPLSTQYWAMGFVNNECPECHKGSIDIDLDGDGRWKTEWYAVPCNVGDSTIRLSIPVYEEEWMAIVISNTRIPVAAVSMRLPGGSWYNLTRQANNMWPYHMEVGDFHGQWPIGVQVTSVMGETFEGEITGQQGNDAPWQFSFMEGAPPHVTAIFPGYGVLEENTPPLTWPEGAVANIGPEPQNPPISSDANGNIFEGEVVWVEDGEQCGGNGYTCQTRDVGQPVKPCVESVWPLARCRNRASFCMRYKNTLFLCTRPSVPGTRRVYEPYGSYLPVLVDGPSPYNDNRTITTGDSSGGLQSSTGVVVQSVQGRRLLRA